MAVFHYKATTDERLPMSDTIAADTPRQARDVLRWRGLLVRELEHQEPRRAPAWWSWRWAEEELALGKAVPAKEESAAQSLNLREWRGSARADP
jgi:type II secretory pathway component PulF